MASDRNGGAPLWQRWASPPRPTGAGGRRALALVRQAWLVAATMSLLGLLGVAAGALRHHNPSAVASAAPAGPGASSGGVTPPAKVPASAVGASSSIPASTAVAGASTTTLSPATTVVATPGVPGATTTVAAPAATVGPDAPSTTQAGPGGSAAESPSGTARAPSSATTPTLPPGTAASACRDAIGEAATEGLGDIDLLAVELERSPNGLLVRFDLVGSVVTNALAVGGEPATNVWQVFLASGDNVLYAFSVNQQGTSWERDLVDFAAASGDRSAVLSAPSGTAIEVLIPAADLVHLPSTFTWWALTNSDRKPPVGAYLGDDCPDGSGDIAAGLSLPPANRRATLSG